MEGTQKRRKVMLITDIPELASQAPAEAFEMTVEASEVVPPPDALAAADLVLVPPIRR